MKLLKLYFLFVKIGAMMIGGGYSMLPLLIRELVEREQLCTEEELLNYFAVAQCTPGVIAVNSATFIGHRVKKVPGAIVATLGVVTVPSVLILLIAALLTNFMEYPIVQHVFAGVRLAACALITSAVYKLFRKTIVDLKRAALFLLAFLLVFALNVSTVYIVIGAAIIGLIVGGISK